MLSVGTDNLGESRVQAPTRVTLVAAASASTLPLVPVEPAGSTRPARPRRCYCLAVARSSLLN